VTAYQLKQFPFSSECSVNQIQSLLRLYQGFNTVTPGRNLMGGCVDDANRKSITGEGWRGADGGTPPDRAGGPGACTALCIFAGSGGESLTLCRRCAGREEATDTPSVQEQDETPWISALCCRGRVGARREMYVVSTAVRCVSSPRPQRPRSGDKASQKVGTVMAQKGKRSKHLR